MKVLVCKFLISISFVLLIGCAHAGVSVEIRSLEISPFVPEEHAESDTVALPSKLRAWVCCRGGEMIGAILPYVSAVDANGSAGSTNILLETDCETRCNYGESRKAKLGRWYGFVNATAWIVGGGRGGKPGGSMDKCVQMKPVSCERLVSRIRNDSSGNGQDAPSFVKTVQDELDRLGEGSMIVRSGGKKLFRALGTGKELVFSDGNYEGGDRLVLEYAILASECGDDAPLVCCWRLSKCDGTFLRSGVWRGSDIEMESQSIKMKRYESGARSLVFKFGHLGAEIRLSTELIIERVVTSPRQ